MVDFTSTQDGVDEQTKRCARLLASVIAQALKDIAIVPTSQEKHYGKNFNSHAYESLKFFYEEESPFKRYAYLVGIDPGSFIFHLENRAFTEVGPENTKIPFLAERDLRVMRSRIKWYKVQQAEAQHARPK
ncbi:hypothetical protein EBT31_07420 [bacterium]|jgi:hypothetical protein|nr:hypothetical protein [bacterium]NBX48482.1 hypothetical protein [bacterium]